MHSKQEPEVVFDASWNENAQNSMKMPIDDVYVEITEPCVKVEMCEHVTVTVRVDTM